MFETLSVVSLETQSITYTAFNKVSKITEKTGNDTYELTISYGPDQQRCKSVLKKNNVVVKTIIFAPGYERVTENGATRHFYYIYGGDGLAAVYVKESGQTDKICYATTDHLGSIVQLTDKNGAEVFAAKYDAWGKQTIATNTIGFHRGYTGHEHLPEFGLINMNGRMYDPVLGRMLSPDNYVQAPYYSQSYNRYSYCVNNPLKYTDPSGEIFGTIITFVEDLIETAFFKGGLDPTSSKARDEAWKKFDPTADWSKTNHAWKIDKGLFISDPKRNLLERYWQIYSRFTWELPQTIVGNFYSHGRNIAGNVDRVDYFGGATFLTKENAGYRNGITLGNYININIDDKIVGSFKNRVLSDPLYMHEYGHTIDSQIFGLSYLFAVGLPSLISAAGSGDHSKYWTEKRANRRAKEYFELHYDVDWSTNTSPYYWGTFEDNYPTY